MAAVDDVKRALVRAEVRAVARRTHMPEKMVMSLAVSMGYDVAAAARAIDDAIRDVFASVSRKLDHEILYGGNAGGGKEDRLYGRSVLQAPRGVVLTCVS